MSILISYIVRLVNIASLSWLVLGKLEIKVIIQNKILFKSATPGT